MRLFAIVNRNLSSLTLTIQSNVSYPCLLSLENASSTHIIKLTTDKTGELVYKFNFPEYISFLPFEEIVQPSPSQNVLSLRLDTRKLTELPEEDVIHDKVKSPACTSLLDDWIFCHDHSEDTTCSLKSPVGQSDHRETILSTVEDVINFLLSQSIGSVCILESEDKCSNLIVKIVNGKAISFMCNSSDESFDRVDESKRNVSLNPSTICLVQFKSLSGTCFDELTQLKQYRSSFYVEWIKVEARTFTEISNLLSDSIKATLTRHETQQNDELLQAKLKEEVKRREEKESVVKEEKAKEGEEEEENEEEAVVSSAVAEDDEKSSRGHRQVKCNSSTTDDSSDDAVHATPVCCIESTSLPSSARVQSSSHRTHFSTGFLSLSSFCTRVADSSSSFIT